MQVFQETGVAQPIENSTEYRNLALDRFYATLLNRAPDALGREFFQAFMAGGGRLDQAAALIYGSPEY